MLLAEVDTGTSSFKEVPEELVTSSSPVPSLCIEAGKVP